MTIGVSDVMKYFNQGKMQWWGWEDTSAGEVYSNLKLLDDTATMPTEDEVNNKIAEMQVQEDRKIAYPAIAEQLDKLFHDIDGGLLGEDAKTGSLYLALKEVKDDNPKPSE
jgi:hypothetical protein